MPRPARHPIFPATLACRHRSVVPAGVAWSLRPRSSWSWSRRWASPWQGRGSRRRAVPPRPITRSGRSPGAGTRPCSTRSESDQRVHIYGTEGRISVAIPFNIPPDRPTEIALTAGGDPPVAPATQIVRFPAADPYAVEAERFAAAILDHVPLPVPPGDAVANLRVMERIFAAGDPHRDA